MKPEIIAILTIFLAFALAEFVYTNLLHKPRQRRKDMIVEVVGTSTLLILTQPLVLFVGYVIG